jgi:hypothetical protein
MALAAAARVTGARDARQGSMNDHLSAWDEVRRIEDELELKIHIATMDARDRWHELKPRLVRLEQAIANKGEHAGDEITQELSELRAALRHLRDEVYARARGDFTAGW